MKELIWFILIGLGIWFFVSVIDGNSNSGYIREDFKNGKSIEMEVDNSISRDNWECTGDCSGHDAGYEWAEEHGISDPSDCGGNSESFIEGCEAYANE